MRSPWGQRILDGLAGRTVTWLSEETGIGDTTLGSIISSAMPKADNALKIAQALGVTVEYLMTGEGLSLDIVALPLVRDLGAGPSQGQEIVGQVALPRQHLTRLHGLRSDLWVSELPVATMGGLGAIGDLIICQGPDKSFQERGVYVFELEGIPTIRRVRRSEEGTFLITDSLDEPAIRAFIPGPGGTGDTIRILARIIGVIRLEQA